MSAADPSRRKTELAMPLLADKHFTEDAGAAENEKSLTRRTPSQRRLLLLALNITLLIMWTLMCMPSSFFPESTVGRQIGGTWQGIIFASWPVGAMVSSPLAGKATRCLGGFRNATLFGLISMAVTLLLFGAVPFVVSSATSEWPFLVLGFMYGVLATVGEMASYALLVQMGAETASVGLYVSLGEVTTGVGCMLGPPIGGVLFAAFGSLQGLNDATQFFLPFAVMAILPVLQIVLVMYVVPRGQPGDGEDDEDGKLPEPFFGGGRSKLRIVLVGIGVVLTAASSAALSPTLEIRLHYLGVPNDSLSSTTGLYLFVSGALYMAMSLPVGRWVDRGCCTRSVNPDGTTFVPPPQPAASSSAAGTGGDEVTGDNQDIAAPSLQGEGVSDEVTGNDHCGGAPPCNVHLPGDASNDADGDAIDGDDLRAAATPANPDVTGKQGSGDGGTGIGGHGDGITDGVGDGGSHYVGGEAGTVATAAEQFRVAVLAAHVQVLPGVKDVVAALANGKPAHYVKTCCAGVPPVSTVSPMVMIAVGAVFNVVALAMVGPLRLGNDFDLEFLDSLPVVMSALMLQGLSSVLIIIPSMPALLVGFADDDELAQGYVAGMWGFVYAAGSAIGPFVGGTLMELKVCVCV